MNDDEKAIPLGYEPGPAVRHDRTARLCLKHPKSGAWLQTPDGRWIEIHLLPMNSHRPASVQKARLEFRLACMGRNIRPLTPQEMAEDVTEVMVAATVSWQGIVVDGVEMPCEPDEVRRLYLRMPWIREQVDVFLGDDSNFTR